MLGNLNSTGHVQLLRLSTCSGWVIESAYGGDEETRTRWEGHWIDLHLLPLLLVLVLFPLLLPAVVAIAWVDQLELQLLPPYAYRYAYYS